MRETAAAPVGGAAELSATMCASKASGDFNVLSSEEAEALVRAASDDGEAGLYRVAIGAGLRMGELRALRWQAVDFGRRLLHVRWAIARHGFRFLGARPVRH